MFPTTNKRFDGGVLILADGTVCMYVCVCMCMYVCMYVFLLNVEMLARCGCVHIFLQKKLAHNGVLTHMFTSAYLKYLHIICLHEYFTRRYIFIELANQLSLAKCSLRYSTAKDDRAKNTPTIYTRVFHTLFL